MAKGTQKVETAAVTSLGSRRAPIEGAVVGRIVAIGDDHLPRVDFEGNEAGPLLARSVVGPLAHSSASLAGGQREVLLNFERNDPLRPIIAGYLRPLAAEGKALAQGELGRLPEHVIVDGQRVRIEGKDEIVLSCGEASITLRRNGRVVIHGTHLESDSLGANWLRGADIQIG